jgi:hypothetical protein
MTPAIQTIFDGLGLSDMKTGIFALSVDPPDDAAVDALRQTGLSVTPLAQDEPFLHVHATNAVNTLTDADLQKLNAVAPQVAWLDLARTGVTDAGLGVLGRLEHLTRLHLENTAVTDAALENLEGLEYLEYLNLYGTKVTDAGLQHLESLPRLRALYVWQTEVTAEAAERLQAANPRLEVNLGWTPVVPASATESPETAGTN